MNRHAMILMTLISLAALSTVLLAACGDAPIAPTATAPAVATVTPAPEHELSDADVARGEQVYLDKQCSVCHGRQGQGGLASPIAHTPLDFDDFLHVQRTASPPKPAFNEVELTAQDAYNMYVWLKSVEVTDAEVPAPRLAEGEVLGMTLWTEGRCDTCHGAFAQGSPEGTTLAGISYPYEEELERMRGTADTIPEHAEEHMGDDVFKRLYEWLKAGANPDDGC